MYITPSRETASEVLRLAAYDAANVFEPICRRVTVGHAISSQSVLDNLPARFAGALVQIARRLQKLSWKSSGDATVECLFANQEAYDFVCQKSASPFWFWRIVALSAELAKSLPLKYDDVVSGAQELRYRLAIGSAYGGNAECLQLQSMSRGPLSDMSREGFVVAVGDVPFDLSNPATMRINPIFAA